MANSHFVRTLLKSGVERVVANHTNGSHRAGHRTAPVMGGHKKNVFLQYVVCSVHANIRGEVSGHKNLAPSEPKTSSFHSHIIFKQFIKSGKTPRILNDRIAIPHAQT